MSNEIVTNPYVGPRAFEEGEEARFFGRERELEELFHLLLARRLVLLHAPSGAGKSSLVRAALIPRLRNEGFLVRPIIRVGSEATAGTNNRFRTATLLSLDEDRAPDERISNNTLANLSLAEYLVYTPIVEAEEVFIFDQFEEILSIDPADRATKTAFFTEIGALLENPRRWALFILREDYLGSLKPFLLPIPTRLAATYRLDLLDPVQAKQAMQGPVRAVGGHFDDEAATRLADDLRQTKVQRPDGSSELVLGQAIEPVQLQVVCYRLWERRASHEITLADIAQAGDVDTALRSYYAERVARVAKESGVSEQVIRDWIEKQLITEAGLRGQVLRAPGVTDGLANAVIRRLVDTHLLRAEERRGATWYEISHDRLIGPVHEDNAAWFESNLSTLQRQARLWDRTNHLDGLLLRGAALVEAEREMAEHELSEIEQAFLAACRAVRMTEERERRRNRLLILLALGASLFGVVALIMAGVASFFYVQANDSADDARAAQINAEEQRQKAQLLLLNPISDQQPALAILLGLQLDQSRASGGRRGAGTLFTVLTSQPELAGFLRAHIGSVNAVAINPEGTMLASAGFDEGIILWDLSTRRPLGPPLFRNADGSLIGHTSAVHSLAFSPDGSLLASAGDDNRVILWDVAGRQPIHVISNAFSVVQVAFSPDGSLLAWGQCTSADSCDAAEIRFLTVSTRQPDPRPLTGFSGVVFDLAFNNAGSQLISGGADHKVYVWSMAERSNSLTFSGHNDAIYAVAFSPDGRRAVSGGLDKTLIVYDLVEGTRSRPIDAGGSVVTSLAFRPGGRMLASAGFNDRILRWEVTGNTLSPLGKPLVAHTGAIQDLAFSTDGAMLASSGQDANVVLWDLNGSDLIRPLANHTPDRQIGVLTPDGRTLITGGDESQILFWDLETGKQAAQPIAVDKSIYALTTSSARHGLLAAGDAGGTVTIWSQTGDERLREWRTDEPAIYTVEINPSGRLLAYGSSDGHVVMREIDTSNTLWEAYLGTNANDSPAVLSAVFNADGSRLYTADDNGQITLWDANTGERIDTVHPHTNRIYQLAFNGPANLLAASSFDNTVSIWDLQSGTQRAPITLGDNAQGDTAAGADGFSLAFSPDGSRLAVGTRSGAISIWNTADSTQVGATLSGNAAPIIALVFSDATTLIANDQNGRLSRWKIPENTPIGEPVEIAGIGSGYALAFQPVKDAPILVSDGNDGQIILSDPQGKKASVTLGKISNSYNALSVAVSSTGTIAAGMGNGEVLIWTAGATEKPAQQLTLSKDKPENERGAIRALAISADGRYLAAGDEDGQARLWEISNLDQPKDLLLSENVQIHQGEVNSLAFSPDGRFLASGGDDRAVVIWEISSLLQIGTLREQGAEVYSLAFSPDSQLLATAGGDDKVMLWNTADWTPVGSPLIGHTEGIRSVAFSPDSTQLATGSYDQTIILWDVASHQPIGSPIPIGGTVWAVAFHPNGSSLAFAADDQEISLIDLSSDTLQQYACMVAGRNMNWAEWQTYGSEKSYTSTCIDQELSYGALLDQANTLAQAAIQDPEQNSAARAQAEQLYLKALEQVLATDSTIFNNRLCWEGSLNGFAKLMLPACEWAVSLTSTGVDSYQTDRNAQVRDSYGLALALSGKYDQAITEFQHYVDWTKQKVAEGVPDIYKHYGRKREGWIARLQKSENPFDAATLAQLQIE